MSKRSVFLSILVVLLVGALPATAGASGGSVTGPTAVESAHPTVNELAAFAPAGLTAADEFGAAIDVWSDATTTTAVVGAPGADSGKGLVYVFTRANGSTTWSAPTTITNPNGSDPSRFGESVAIRGAAIAVGEPGGGAGAGKAYLYSDGATVARTLTGSAGAALGTSVDVAGSTFVAGGPGTDMGEAKVSGLGFLDQPETVTKTGAASGDLFGAHVSLSSDGTKLAVGAPGHEADDRGGIWIYNRTGTSPQPLAYTVVANGDPVVPSAAVGAAYGPVSIDGTRFAAGGPGVASGAGEVALYDLSDLTTPVNTFTTADGAAGDAFGSSVYLRGDRLAVAAPNDSFNPTGAGTLYLFDEAASAVAESAAMRLSTAANSDALGGGGVALAPNGTVVASARTAAATASAFMFDGLPLAITGPTFNPTSVDFGESFTVSATLSDLAAGANKISSASYTLELTGSPGVEGPFPLSAKDGTFDEVTEETEVTIGPGTYVLAGEFTICITAVGVDGLSADECGVIEVNDASGPVIRDVSFSPGVVVPPSSTVTIAATLDEFAAGGSTVKSGEASLNAGAPVAMVPDDGTFDESVEKATVEITAPAIDGPNEVCLQAFDALDNVSDNFCVQLTVDGSVPGIAGNTLPASVSFGSDAEFSFSAFDGTTPILSAEMSVEHSSFLAPKAANAVFVDLLPDDGAFDEQVEEFTGAVSGTDDLPITGDYEVCFRVADQAGNTTTTCRTLTVDPPEAGKAPAGRSNESACPSASVPDAGFTDINAANVHFGAVNCIAWYSITSGKPNGSGGLAYDPLATVTRGQMATFVASLITKAGGSLDGNAPNAFGDDNGSVHERNINALAAAGVAAGTSSTTFSPEDPVRRDQMGTFLANAFKFVMGSSAPATHDYFPDDGASVHQDNINAMAEAGVASGKGDGSFAPLDPVQRDQMGSFVSRLLDVFTDFARSTPPTP